MSEDVTRAPVVKSRPRRFARFLLRVVLLLVIPLLCVFAGITYYYSGGRYVTTENAYVKAPILTIASEISGRVSKVYVQENQVIRPGQILLLLEEMDFELALKEAEAERIGTIHEIENRRAEYRQAAAEIQLAEERRRFLKSRFEREQKLVKKGIGRGAKLDEARHLLRAAERSLSAARERRAGILAKLGGDPKLPIEAHPIYIAAVARVNRARLNLDRTMLVSRIGGIIAKMNLEPGEYIDDGKAVFAVVQAGKSWIEVNLKETELTHLKYGQKATFVAESYPDIVWQATVDSISPATGAEFAVLPPQNASGNWVKVVQRLPVRLKILPSEGREMPELRAGMSVTVKIDTEHQRKAPPFISQVLAATRKMVGTQKSE
jgi:membrane fusion protein (multidrug efflux system)